VFEDSKNVTSPEILTPQLYIAASARRHQQDPQPAIDPIRSRPNRRDEHIFFPYKILGRYKHVDFNAAGKRYFYNEDSSERA
jgi:hypothetical protein